MAEPGTGLRARMTGKLTSVRAVCLGMLVAVVCVVNLAVGLSCVFRPATEIPLGPEYLRMLDVALGAFLGSYLTRSGGQPPGPANGGTGQ